MLSIVRSFRRTIGVSDSAWGESVPPPLAFAVALASAVSFALALSVALALPIVFGFSLAAAPELLVGVAMFAGAAPAAVGVVVDAAVAVEVDCGWSVVVVGGEGFTMVWLFVAVSTTTFPVSNQRMTAPQAATVSHNAQYTA